MHLTRLGFNMIVIVYLAPLLAIDILGNTMSVGISSDYYYYKAIFDGLLLVYAAYSVFQGPTASVNDARARVHSTEDDVVDFSQVGAIEYVYCLMLSAYSAVNWYFLHDINKASTGLMSMGTLIWSLLSVAIAILAFIQFYNLKRGKIVELRKKIVQ